METASFVISIIVASLLLFPVIVCLISCTLVAFLEGVRKRRWIKQGRIFGDSTKNTPAQRKGKKNLRRAYDGIYKGLSMLFSIVPSNSLRRFLYQAVFHMEIAKGACIHKGAEIRDGYKICIGPRTIVGDDCILDGRGTLVIGNDVNISSRASIYTAQHQINSPDFSGEFKGVTIGHHAWISANTVVLPGVSVGEGAVLAAGGIATKNLDPFNVYGGVPAKKIGERNRELCYLLDGPSTLFF